MAQSGPVTNSWREPRPGARPLTWIAAAAAWTTLGAAAIVLAAVLAATLVIAAVTGVGALALAALALRGRRRAAADPDLIEARHVGGHAWIASGWRDQP